ncbi:MAG: indole-3-glycerol phosphate synthase, partial [Chloroflexota bacterium]|nr:indole-3-glycerol phosphate synthase [Chloroflexota bacterium]
EIVARQREALAAAAPDEGRLHALALARGAPRDFAGALLAGPEPALVAECKRRSPVKGVLAEEYDAADIARDYEAGGASAVSVLTNADFDGTLDHLARVWAAVRLPLLRKDFVVDSVQLLEARAHGADCVLLIARILDRAELAEMVDRAHELGLQVLVEVHEEAEVEAALASAPDLLGVNQRNLETFEVDAGLAARVAAGLPDTLHLVAESGFASRADVVAAGAAGARAVLVGETLMRAADREAKVRELVGVVA